VKTLTQNVRVDAAPAVVIERNIATRLYPIGASPATITVRFNAAFSGTFTEYAPLDFVIGLGSATLNHADGSEPTTLDMAIVDNPANKTFTVEDINAQPGDTLVVSYSYDAPDVSPMYYTLGPISLNSVN
jgi:hypothetical protein